MSNQFFDAMESGDIARDIKEIESIIRDYDNARYPQEIRNIDDRAKDKIMKMRDKDMDIRILTAPKAGNPGIPVSQAEMPVLYNTLASIKAYLEAKLISKQGGDNDA